ncbi:MAG TPA: hypothetical protein VIX13_05365, partial [Candidatus Eisenbacteria bacterium]
PRQIVVLPTGTGEAKRITNDSMQHHYASFLDDRRIVFAGSEPGRAVRLYVQDISGGAPRPISPEGVQPGVIIVSPDARWVAGMSSEWRAWLYSTHGDPGRQIPGLLPGDRPIKFGDGGRTLYVRRGEYPLRVFRVDLPSGKLEPWKEVSPADPAGLVSLYGPRMTADGRAYAYTYARQLSDLYLVDGLK